MNISDIITLLHPTADRRTDIVLQDDGQGIYIAHWDESKFGPQPTEQELLDQASSVQLGYDNNIIKQQRASEYASVVDQLDMLYKDKINNTNTWVDHITGVKTKHPKKESI
jgi:hypothetical protein